jgi:hypothetical protein
MEAARAGAAVETEALDVVKKRVPAVASSRTAA